MNLLAPLFQFLCRLSIGLALPMFGLLRSGAPNDFFRNHLYVLLGFNTFATLIAYRLQTSSFGWSLAASIASYVGAALFLYHKRGTGGAMLPVAALCALIGALHPGDSSPTMQQWLWRVADVATGSGVLGLTIAAMFLGHWYLNSPTMRIAPLKSLVAAMALAVALRIVLCGAGLAAALNAGTSFAGLSLALLALRWLAGLAAPLVVAWMTWQTLKIPNTQSATGILYVGVITTFIGELAGMLLASDSAFPL